jgi:hypothetical protein
VRGAAWLPARADRIVREVDAFHRGCRNASQRLVRLSVDGETPGVDLVLGNPPKLSELRAALARRMPQPALKGEHA